MTVRDKRRGRQGRTALSLVERAWHLGVLQFCPQQIAHLNRIVGQQRKRGFA